MRILVYPHSLDVGGSQLNAIELAAAVRNLDHQVSVFAAEAGSMTSILEAFGLSVEIAPMHRRRPSMTIVGALRRLCRRERIDVLHCYEWPPCIEGFYGPGVLDGVRVGCTVMSMSVAPFMPASVPLVVGTEQIADAVRATGRLAVDVIEPPVDTRQNHPRVDAEAFRAEYGAGDGLTLVIVSRLVQALKFEGIARAVKAMEALAQDFRLRLIVVGDGPVRSELERLAAEVNATAREPLVTFTGELADPRPAYAAADVVMGMGGSALRAMAFAKPVVILGELGFAKVLSAETLNDFLWQGFYGLGDGDDRPKALAEVLRPLLSSAQRRRELGAFARNLVETRFSLEVSAQRQVVIYERWLEQQWRPGSAFLDAVWSTGRLAGYKMRRRANRWLGRAAAEDFNTVEKIIKTAEQARSVR